MSRAHSVHIDLDGSWTENSAVGKYVDARAWGPRLRYSTSETELVEFFDFVRHSTAPFTLFGSGDFHHLSGLWIRQVADPFVLVSFDNHPDWDTRPPRWCCGTWINRALELSALRQVSIWGCGNFELNWPGYRYVDAEALRAERIEVWPWHERLKESGQKRWARRLWRESWRDEFGRFAARLADKKVYVTVDMDCLEARESATNWEQGLFRAEDIAWALGEIRRHGEIVAGDLCGAYSPQSYARWPQRFAAWMDHPRKPDPELADAAARNERVFETIWPALTNEVRERSENAAAPDRAGSAPDT
jgi:hypothetical protein